LKDGLLKIWFLPILRRDFFRSEVLNLSGDMKELVEDGYLEHRFGREGV
jgi:hypothetical protein